jgi:hypothetical protein
MENCGVERGIVGYSRDLWERLGNCGVEWRIMQYNKELWEKTIVGDTRDCGKD